MDESDDLMKDIKKLEGEEIASFLKFAVLIYKRIESLSADHPNINSSELKNDVLKLITYMEAMIASEAVVVEIPDEYEKAYLFLFSFGSTIIAVEFTSGLL